MSRQSHHADTRSELFGWRRLFTTTTAAVLIAALSVLAPLRAAHAADGGFHIVNGRLFDANGNDFIIRGISHPHAWYSQRTQSFADIKVVGANSVRVVLSGGRWPVSTASDVANVISLCKQNRLICVLENHDTTGYGEASGAYSLSQAVDYWLSIRSALVGQEAYIIINIGNEPYGNTNPTEWVAATLDAIRRLRSAGLTHTLMIDAPNWGQDWSNTMRDNAQTIWEADALRNSIFSVHMYGVYNTPSKVKAYLDSFTSRGLPILVGEFGWYHSDGDPDELTVTEHTTSLGLGYIGWSWSGNGGGVEYLDMVNNFNSASRTDWGTWLITSANGLEATSVEASVFGGGVGDTQRPTAPGNLGATGTTLSSVSLAWSASTDNVAVTGYDVYRGALRVATLPSSMLSYKDTGLSANTTYKYTVYARDAAGNVSEVSNTVSATTQSSGGETGGCTATYQVASEWGTGFGATVTVTNTGTTVTQGWTVSWTFGGNQQITNMWSATPTQSGASVTARNVGYNGVIQPGSNTTFGFQAAYSGSNTSPTLTCTVN
ncbi:cellulose binding domain-containing protein [Stigmatella sp. ncwal1]|uniref:Endoglucanase n=1 Tax=Stigmatella ashevillensis TaxID=2995309 RepID=A0ABT5D9E3_9BACT|nr:cellulase family glycosylhydrolase [Stigmatella ashevillena]MDC0708902.1 cellulose binding domain-containing protein [Stigmatella ashevillena]